MWSGTSTNIPGRAGRRTTFSAAVCCSKGFRGVLAFEELGSDGCLLDLLAQGIWGRGGIWKETAYWTDRRRSMVRSRYTCIVVSSHGILKLKYGELNEDVAALPPAVFTEQFKVNVD